MKSIITGTLHIISVIKTHGIKRKREVHTGEKFTQYFSPKIKKRGCLKVMCMAG